MPGADVALTPFAGEVEPATGPAPAPAGATCEVYKYVVPERLDVLRAGRIRFTQADALNDPFELRPQFDAVVSEAELRAVIPQEPGGLTPELRPFFAAAWAKTAPEVRAMVPLDVFERFVDAVLLSDEGKATYAEILELTLGMIRDATATARDTVYGLLGARVGILSLSRAPDHPLMWAHYAANHRGFVIAFDAGHPFFDRRRGPDDEFYYLRDVVYRAPRAAATLGDLQSEDVFLTKSPEWAYEVERRLLAPVDDAGATLDVGGEPVYLFAFPPDAVRAIILGARCTAEFAAELRRLVAANPCFAHVELRLAELDASTGRIRITGGARAG